TGDRRRAPGCPPRGGPSRLFDPVAQGEDRLQSLHRRPPVVLLVLLGKLLVGDQVGVLLALVVPLGAVAPSVIELLPGPVLAGIPGQELGQLLDGFRQRDARGVAGCGPVGQRNPRLYFLTHEPGADIRGRAVCSIRETPSAERVLRNRSPAHADRDLPERDRGGEGTRAPHDRPVREAAGEARVPVAPSGRDAGRPEAAAGL